MPRITVIVEPFIEDLLAEFCFASRRRIRAAAFIGAARVESKPNQVIGSLRLKNYGIDARFECSRVSRCDRFLDRLARNALSIEFGDIKMIAEKIAGAAAIGRARGDGKADQTRSRVANPGSGRLRTRSRLCD